MPRSASLALAATDEAAAHLSQVRGAVCVIVAHLRGGTLDGPGVDATVGELERIIAATWAAQEALAPLRKAASVEWRGE